MRYCFLFLLVWSGFLTSCGEDENESVCAIPLLVETLEVTDTSSEINWISSTASSFLIAYRPADGAAVDEQVVTTVETSIVLINLLPDTTYEVRVKAFCEENDSAFSETFLFTTAAPLCTPITESTHEVIDYNETFVDWEVLPLATSWEIEYGLSGFALGEGIIKPADESQIVLDALIVGTTYDYYIKTFCGGTENSYSGVFSFTTEACEIPTNVEVFNVTSTSVTFHWNGEGQEVWEFEYGLENFELGTGSVLFTDTIPSSIENLEANTRYDFYIRANCGPNGRSDYVGPILIETLL